MKYRSRRTKDQWKQIVEDFNTSDLTMRSFCEQRDIAYASLVKHKRQFADSKKQPKNMGFIEVRPKKTPDQFPELSSKTLTLHLSEHRKLEWAPGIDPQYIANLIGLLS